MYQEFRELWPSLDLVVDGGAISHTEGSSRLGSTVVDLSQPGTFTIIRPGMYVMKEENPAIITVVVFSCVTGITKRL